MNMTRGEMTLNNLQIGESAEIVAVGGAGALRQHFLDMGLIPGAEVTLVKFAPMGDPMELLIHGYELTLRLEDAAKRNKNIEGAAEGEKQGAGKDGAENRASGAGRRRQISCQRGR